MAFFVCFSLLLRFIDFFSVVNQVNQVNSGNSGKNFPRELMSLLIGKETSLINYNKSGFNALAKLQEIFNILDSKVHLERVGRTSRFKPEYKEIMLRIWEDTPSTPFAKVLRSSVIPFLFAVFLFSLLENRVGFWRGSPIFTKFKSSMLVFLYIRLLLGFLIKVNVEYDNQILCSSVQPDGSTITVETTDHGEPSMTVKQPDGTSIKVEPHPDHWGWSKLTKKNSNGEIVEVTHAPNDRVPAYLSQGSGSNPISVDDSDSSTSSPKPAGEGSVSNPLPISDSEDSDSDLEKEEAGKKKPKNSSPNDNDNGKGGGSNPTEGPSSAPAGSSEGAGSSAGSSNRTKEVLGSLLGSLGGFLENILDVLNNLYF